MLKSTFLIFESPHFNEMIIPDDYTIVKQIQMRNNQKITLKKLSQDNHN